MLGIDAALRSDDALLRALALLDRRVGKRRLVVLAAASEQLPTGLERTLLELRLEAAAIEPGAPLLGLPT